MDDVQDKLAALWTQQLKCGDVTADSDFFDCGGTSIAAVYLAAAVQETFGVSFDALEIVVEQKLGSVARLISARLAPVS